MTGWGDGMNRELKFRAWDTTFKRMKLSGMGINRGVLGAEESDIIMQYTGLKDKHGKELYEGDVLKYQSSPLYRVSFSEAQFVLLYQVPDGGGQIALTQRKAGFMEVIGNVFENGDLLK